MIDTVVLTFEKDQFEIINPDRFSPSARMMDIQPSRIGRNGCIKCFRNPGKEDLARGIKSILGKTATATLKRMQSDMGMMEPCKSITSALKKISDDLEQFDPIRLPNTIGTQKSELLTGE